MARLVRKNIKVFAGGANNNGIFGSLQANNPTLSNDVEQIQSLAAWETGWDAATETSEELPPIEEMNSISYVTTYQQAYLMQEGMPEWSTTVTFYKGSLTKEVTSTGFRIYCSLTDNNTGNQLSDTSNWKKVMDSEDLYAFDSAVVKLTGNQTVAGTKTFSASPIAPTPTTGDNSTKVATTAFVAENSVNLYENQTINGTKTFNSSPVMPTPADGDNSTKGATTEFVKNNIRYAMPTGSILPFGGSAAPTGFLLCDGSAVSRTTYATLFAVIGTTYGSGDGTTTFNLPQLENLVYNVETNVPCKGNGKNIGLRSATRGALSTIQDFGLYGSQSTPMGSTVPHFNASTQAVNGVAGQQVSGTSTTININNYGIGLSQNANNSGIVGTVTRSVMPCKYIIKY